MKEIQRGDVFYASLYPTIGSEQGGIRPVLVVQNDTGNHFSPTVIIAPITARHKKALPTHVDIRCAGLRWSSRVLLEQIRTIDKSRLKEFMGNIGKDQLHKVDRATSISLGLEERYGN